MTTTDACHRAYRDVVRMARRFVFTDDDARDLAQDALMIALDRGFDDWSAPARRAWLHGVLCRLAAHALSARSSTRATAITAPVLTTNQC